MQDVSCHTSYQVVQVSQMFAMWLHTQLISLISCFDIWLGGSIVGLVVPINSCIVSF